MSAAMQPFGVASHVDTMKIKGLDAVLATRANVFIQTTSVPGWQKLAKMEAAQSYRKGKTAQLTASGARKMERMFAFIPLFAVIYIQTVTEGRMK